MAETFPHELKIIGERIREIRTGQKMSQATLAEKADLSTAQVSAMENGRSNMLLLSFLRVVEALQVSADEILRPDTPNVNLMYQNELASMLSSCTPTEFDSIMKIVKQVLDSMQAAKNSDND